MGFQVTACKIRFQTRFAAFCQKTDARASMWPRHSHRTTVSCSWAAEGHGAWGSERLKSGARQGPARGVQHQRRPIARLKLCRSQWPCFSQCLITRSPSGRRCCASADSAARHEAIPQLRSDLCRSVPRKGKRFVQETEGTLIAVVSPLHRPPSPTFPSSPFASPHPSLFWGPIFAFLRHPFFDVCLKGSLVAGRRLQHTLCFRWSRHSLLDLGFSSSSILFFISLGLWPSPITKRPRHCSSSPPITPITHRALPPPSSFRFTSPG